MSSNESTNLEDFLEHLTSTGKLSCKDQSMILELVHDKLKTAAEEITSQAAQAISQAKEIISIKQQTDESTEQNLQELQKAMVTYKSNFKERQALTTFRDGFLFGELLSIAHKVKLEREQKGMETPSLQGGK